MSAPLQQYDKLKPRERLVLHCAFDPRDRERDFHRTLDSINCWETHYNYAMARPYRGIAGTDDTVLSEKGFLTYDVKINSQVMWRGIPTHIDALWHIDAELDRRADYLLKYETLVKPTPKLWALMADLSARVDAMSDNEKKKIIIGAMIQVYRQAQHTQSNRPSKWILLQHIACYAKMPPARVKEALDQWANRREVMGPFTMHLGPEREIVKARVRGAAFDGRPIYKLDVWPHNPDHVTPPTVA